MRARFDAVREAVISAPRDASSLRAEIVAMRERMAGAHHASQRQVRHQSSSAGGMIDAEFVMQFLVLSQSTTHPK